MVDYRSQRYRTGTNKKPVIAFLKNGKHGRCHAVHTVHRFELGLSFLDGLVHEVVERRFSVLRTEVQAGPHRVRQLLEPIRNTGQGRCRGGCERGTIPLFFPHAKSHE